MANQELVTVYSFRVLDSGYESAPVSRFKATREMILNEHGGDPLEATAEQVAADELDAAGRYRRVASGWGDPR